MEADMNSRKVRWFKRKSFKTSVVTIIIILGLSLFSLQIYLAYHNAKPIRFLGTSMQPSINDGDRLFLSHAFEKVERGDIVAFDHRANPSQTSIRRVIGLPGETIHIDELGKVYINGSVIEEPYVSPERHLNPRQIPEQVIEEYHYYVMGDNRDASNDSRSFGPVSGALIYGKVMVKYWPLGKAVN